jgi:two-component system chemotaxis response regulator CheB
VIRILVVDDSAVVRKILTEELSKYSDIQVVGTAVDPYVARDKIVELSPDVITLDIEMPRMDGLSFLAKLMQHHPLPVVIVSSVTPKNSDAAIRALELGAVEVISKPGSAFTVPDVGKQLVRAIRAAAQAKLVRAEDRPETSASGPAAARSPYLAQMRATHKILAIGASTGGTKAIEVVLSGLPVTTPGTVICQHMPPFFTASFAARLNGISQMEVREARDNDSIVPGVALVAPGNHHMLLERDGARFIVKLKDGPAVHYQRPSVDVLFDSVARKAGRNAVGVLLTGMGTDGAKGLLAMRESGAYTLAEDESTCIVFGMPKEAIKLDAVDEVVPLGEMSNAIVDALIGQGRQAVAQPA